MIDSPLHYVSPARISSLACKIQMTLDPFFLSLYIFYIIEINKYIIYFHLYLDDSQKSSVIKHEYSFCGADQQ